MQGVDIDSERKENLVRTDANLNVSNHCVLIMEQSPLSVDDPAPRWRTSVTLTLRDPALGQEALQVTLPAVYVGPILHRRQVVAVAHYPGAVMHWEWRFESDNGRARASVWLHPGTSARDKAGILVLPTLEIEP